MLGKAGTQDAAERKRRTDYMREWSRRRGAIPIKGAVFICERCRKVAETTGRQQKWCGACKPLVAAEKSRRLAKSPIGTVLRCGKCADEFAKRAVSQIYCEACGTKRKKPERRIGYPWPCAHCRIEIIVNHPRNVYCDACHALQKRGALPSIRKAMVVLRRARRKSDPQYALSRNISTAIWRSLEDGKGGRAWETLVDYTVADLMRHLERGFLKGMTWDNRGRWHVDHIIPLASFTFTNADDPDFRAAWSIANLRPLWSTDNLTKHAKRTLLL